ncbi:MAG: cyclic nucleotide-binding domain-containing protein, partial [Actinomycetia bacterium]|nr:cyclic nucleotide-binding domain-containing protein [Actinomycetes bacterium]
MNPAVHVLAGAPFFDPFSADDLTLIARDAVMVDFAGGQTLFELDQPADTLHVLVSGVVELVFPHEEAADTSGIGIGERWTVADSGRIVGWSALVPPYAYNATAIAAEPVSTLAIPGDSLRDLATENPALGVLLMRQVLTVIGNRIRETRIRRVAQRYDDEVLAVELLIEENSEQLSITSPLRKLPIYLRNRLTISDAFAAIELLTVHGDELERSLAEVCLDLMTRMRRELDIFQRLQAIYQQVAAADSTRSPSQLRDDCSAAFCDLFEETDYVIRGMDLLPDSPGQLFIMNHLTNDDENLLPNGFRLTIDTHFVAAMILFRKYGQAPVRVIRKANPDEYAHQMYYDRLGYIYVYRGHVDPVGLAKGADERERRRDFLLQTSSCLEHGENVVICPEGNCCDTEDSPLPFKAGAF